MISLTEKAVAKVKELADADGVGHYNIRLKVIGGGCSGYGHDMSFEEKIDELDETIEQNGIKIIVDPLSMQYLEGTEVDYIEGTITSGFKFLSPKSTGNCGCGSSVSY